MLRAAPLQPLVVEVQSIAKLLWEWTAVTNMDHTAREAVDKYDEAGGDLERARALLGIPAGGFSDHIICSRAA